MKKISLAAAIVLISASAAMAESGVFDKPLETKTVSLAARGDAAKAKLTCLYYPHFMLKEIDEGEVGAAQLSILPADPKPPCQRENLAQENVVDPKDWSGYVEGAKGDFVFFSAEDGVNGALGFAIFSPAGQKLFEDSAVGDFHSVLAAGETLTLRYLRSFEGPCSVLKEGAGCWTKIAGAAHLDASATPDCAAGYRRAKNELAKGRCEADRKASDPVCIAAALKEIDAQHWEEAPSVIEYEVEAELVAGTAKITPLAQASLCQPSD